MTVRLCILASTQDSAHQLELEKQLAPHRELITHWCATNILAGSEIFSEAERQIRSAQIVVWLISPDFRFTEEQSPAARLTLELERSGSLRVIPVLVRNTTHYRAPYAGRAVFPDNKLPVTAWQDRDSAWRNVMAGIRRVAEQLMGISGGYGPVSQLPSASGWSAPPASMGGGASLSPVSAPPVSLPVRPSNPAVAPVSAPPISLPVRSSTPGVSMRGAHSRTPAPLGLGGNAAPPPVIVPPPSNPSIPVRSSRGWVLGLMAIALLGGLWFYFGGKTSSSETSAPSSRATTIEQPPPPKVSAPSPRVTSTGPSPAPASTACCGGVDCPKEQHQGSGTTCDVTPDFCRTCPSGRRRVSGACSDAIPSTSLYRLRYAGATLPGYVPGKTDTICVRAPGAAPICAIVSDAEKSPLLGKMPVSSLSMSPGLDVWFERSGVRMRTLAGMRLDPAKATYTSSALCVGAVLYSPGKADILRFYLDDP